MLNFRYHVVSLVAVFLALGIGVIMGSAVIDRATIDVLEDQEAQLRRRIEEQDAHIAELEAELGTLQDQQQSLADEGSEVLLDGRLVGAPVALMVGEGGGGDAFDALTALLAGADAQVLGTVRIRDRLSLEDEGARRDLAQLLSRPQFSSATTLRRAAMEAIAGALAGETGASGAVSAAQQDNEEEPATGLIAALAEAGFVELQPGEGAPDGALERPPIGTQVVMVWEPGDEDELARGVLLARAVAALPIPMVVAEESPAATEEGGEGDEGDPMSLVQAIRADAALASQASTVDNLDRFSGRLATVLALAAQGRGEVGHFGTGEGAQRLLPPPSEPATGD